MKRKEKTINIERRIVEFWALPKKQKVSFDQALLNLGVHVKG